MKNENLAAIVILNIILFYLVIGFIDFSKIENLVADTATALVSFFAKALIVLAVLAFSFKSVRKLLQTKDMVSVLAVLCAFALALSLLFPARRLVLLDFIGPALGVGQLYIMALAAFVHIYEAQELRKGLKKRRNMND